MEGTRGGVLKGAAVRARVTDPKRGDGLNEVAVKVQGVGPTREAVLGREVVPTGAVGQAREVAVRTLAEIPAEYGHPGVAKVSHRRRLSLVSPMEGIGLLRFGTLPASVVRRLGSREMAVTLVARSSQDLATRVTPRVASVSNRAVSRRLRVRRQTPVDLQDLLPLLVDRCVASEIAAMTVRTRESGTSRSSATRSR